jgi:hypothetical protein
MKPDVIRMEGQVRPLPRPRRNNPTEAVRQIAAIRLRELRQSGKSHDEIAVMFGLTPGRIHQLCGDLCGEDAGEYQLHLR